MAIVRIRLRSSSEVMLSTVTERIRPSCLALYQRCNGRNAGSTSHSSCTRPRPSRIDLAVPSEAVRVTNSGRISGCGVCQLGTPPCSSRMNQKKPYPGNVNRYGRSPIGGKGVRLANSTGANPRNSERSSSTACDDRDRLATQRMRSSSNSRRYARILRFVG